MLAIERSSLKISQSLSMSCFLIPESDCNAKSLSFDLKLTEMSTTKSFLTSDLT